MSRKPGAIHLQHAASYWRHGPVGFGERFRSDAEFREGFEVEAYEAMAELRYWLSGLLPIPAEYNLVLAHGYLMTPSRIPARVVEATRQRLALGEFTTEVGRLAMIWLREYHPDLCGCVLP